MPWLTTTDLATDLAQSIPTAQTATAQAAVDAAIAIVESYCDRTFTGTEPWIAAVQKVALRIAGDFYANPLTRDSFTGPESFTYTGTRGSAILTTQEMAALDPFSQRYGFA